MATDSSEGGDGSSLVSQETAAGWKQVREWTGSRWSRFNEWRAQRPFLGGVLLMLAGLIIVYVPMQILPDIIFIGGQVAGFLAVGVMFGVFVFLSGAYALYKPEFSDEIGVAGIVLSILSLFGSLGGLFLGLILGILGGNLCIAWKPKDGGEGDPSKVDKAAAGVRERGLHVVETAKTRLGTGSSGEGSTER